MSVCVSSFSFDPRLTSCLNRRIGQKLGGQSLKRWPFKDFERSNITLVATLIRRLVDLRLHENIVVD